MRTSAITALIFDLDGTLIDSSASILASYRSAFAQAGCEPAVPLVSAIIGPPLMPTLQRLSPHADPAQLQTLARAFMDHYDQSGYLETAVFPGVHDLLTDAHAAGYPLWIATNKRIHPTRLILEHLDWMEFFQGVYALDAFEPRLPAKAQVIERLVQQHALDAETSLYVGDTEDDRLAAHRAGLPFYMADWGYGLATAGAEPHSQAAHPAILALRRLLAI